MYSVYFSNESAGDRASNLRTSCLRSSNRSFRKSFPSQVNKSNAKKHGGFPRRNIRFLNCGLPRLSREFPAELEKQITAALPNVRAVIDGEICSLLTPRSFESTIPSTSRGA